MERGQATAEYVALVALVGCVLALAAGLTSGGVGGQVLAGIQRGLCRVAEARCPEPEPARPDLDPCPVERQVRGERLGTTIAVVRVGTSGTLSAVRGSDGRVTVTLAGGEDAGAELGAGARLRLGRRSIGGQATAGARVTWTSGRSWSFRDEAAARRFVETYGRKATIEGKLLDGIRSRCSLLCDAIGWRPHRELPPPAAEYAEAGAGGALTASLGVGHAGLEAGTVVGRERRRDGATTWHLELDGAATAGLGLGDAMLDGVATGEAAVAYALDPRGRPHTLRLSLAGEARADARVALAGGGGRAAVGAGLARVVELDATLDLREPANRRAAVALLASLSNPGELAALPSRVRALGERLARRGQLDRRVYAVVRAEDGFGLGVRLGLALDGGLDRTTSGLRLLRAETRLPGLPFLPRDDCRAA